MSARPSGPALLLAGAALAILFAALMDRRPEGAPFAALVVGTLGLHLLLPIGLIWQFADLVRRWRGRSR